MDAYIYRPCEKSVILYTLTCISILGEDQWTKISPGCVKDHNIEPSYTGKTIEQCKELCRKESKCVAIEVYANHGKSASNVPPGACFLNDDREYASCEAMAKKQNLDLYITPGNCLDTYCHISTIFLPTYGVI